MPACWRRRCNSTRKRRGERQRWRAISVGSPRRGSSKRSGRLAVTWPPTRGRSRPSSRPSLLSTSELAGRGPLFFEATMLDIVSELARRLAANAEAVCRTASAPAPSGASATSATRRPQPLRPPTRAGLRQGRRRALDRRRHRRAGRPARPDPSRQSSERACRDPARSAALSRPDLDACEAPYPTPVQLVPRSSCGMRQGRSPPAPLPMLTSAPAASPSIPSPAAFAFTRAVSTAPTSATRPARLTPGRRCSAVSDQDAEMTGLQRIWLDPTRATKAPVATPRRALGHLLGHAVRFGWRTT